MPYLGYNEPLWSTSDDFITKRRLHSTQDGNLVNWWEESKMASSVFVILEGYSLVLQQSKSVSLLVTSNFELERMDSNKHSQSDFALSLDFHCLKNFAKGINLLCKASLWCVLLHKRAICTSKSDQYIPLWWAKLKLECLIIIRFIYFNSKFKVTCKIEDFKCQCIIKHFKEKSLKFVLFQLPFCFFSHQNSLTNLPS